MCGGVLIPALKSYIIKSTDVSCSRAIDVTITARVRSRGVKL
jgi:hypothetical protein